MAVKFVSSFLFSSFGSIPYNIGFPLYTQFIDVTRDSTNSFVTYILSDVSVECFITSIKLVRHTRFISIHGYNPLH